MNMFDDIIKEMNQKHADFNKTAKEQGETIEQLLGKHLPNTEGIYSSGVRGYQLKKDETTPLIPSSLLKKESTPEQVKKETLEDVMAQLHDLIGLEEIKSSVDNLVDRLAGQKVLAENSSIKISNPNLHMIYSGPPGTGKTEVARIVAKILHHLGYIKTDKVIETDRSGLVEEHAGGTAKKVMAKVKESLDGVLFIDEAYALANNDNFGKEAIDTLIKALEDYRGQFVVIMAGYEAEMDRLISENPGFKSRIPHRYRFKDYTPKELTNIAKMMLTNKGYKTDDVMKHLENYISIQCKNGSLEGNARTVRNFVERITDNHLIRVGKTTPDCYETITAEDVRAATGFGEKNANRAGLDSILEEGLTKFEELEGLIDIKSEIRRLLNFFTVQQRKREQGINTPLPEMNMVFTGGPGTGKTEVARIIGQILKGNGVLPNGHLREVSRGDLVGNVVGDTAQKVKKVVAESLGGILFIDRAYSLYSEDSYSAEAIDTLLKELDDCKGDLVVILAGYEEGMKEMLENVEGFSSRFRYHFPFADYSNAEVFEMTKKQLKAASYDLSDECLEHLWGEMEKQTTFVSNGRWASEFAERIQIIQSDRLIIENSSDFSTLTVQDVSETLKDMS